MKEILKILILTTSSLIGSIISVNIGFDLIRIDEEKISIWILLLIGLIGALIFWKITDFIMKRMFKK